MRQRTSTADSIHGPENSPNKIDPSELTSDSPEKAGGKLAVDGAREAAVLND